MKRAIQIIAKVPRQKRRAIELYAADSPFRGRVEQSRKAYQRKPKNQKEVDKGLDWC